MSQMLKDTQEAGRRVRDLLAADAAVYSELGERLRSLDPALVATIARGSSDHGASYASYLIPLCTGRVVASVAPSLVTVLKAPLNLKKQFVLAISQSGRSPDIIATFSRAKESGALTAALVNDTASPVAEMADVFLPQHAGTESIAATKTVICTFTAIARLTAEWTKDKKMLAALQRLPDCLDQAYQAGLQLDDQVLKGISNVYVLSRGLGLSCALETALKLKETCGVHAEAFSTAEVRHGPREIVDRQFLVIALALPGNGHDDVVTAARELEAQGARLMLIDPMASYLSADDRLNPIVILQLLYPWLARSSKVVGHDPDHMRTLKSKVIKTT